MTSALAWSAATFVVVSVLLVLLPLYSFQNIPRGWYAAATLLPQALPLAIPIGIAFGMAFGLHARPAAGITRMMLVCALATSVLSFGILAWAMPAGNRAFKEITIQKLWGTGGYHGAITEPWTPHNEMNLAELRQQITKFSERGDVKRERHFGFQFHLRFSLAAAALALVGMLLAVPINHRGLRGLLAFAVCLLYGVLIATGEALAVSSFVAPSFAGTVPPLIGAWLPNIVIGALALIVASSRSSRLRGSLSGAQ
jgi:Lipopolysaccharide export system permease LptF/LptG